MDHKTFTLDCLFRVSREIPGFAICIFRDEHGRHFTQKTDREGIVDGFLLTNTKGSVLGKAPKNPDGSEITATVGEPFLYAFNRLDGSPVVGARSVVEDAVRAELPKFALADMPFTWEEAANFVGDAEQQKLAGEVTARLLQRSLAI